MVVGGAQTDTTNTIIRMWVTFGTSVAIFVCDAPDHTGSGSCLGDFSETSQYAGACVPFARGADPGHRGTWA